MRNSNIALVALFITSFGVASTAHADMFSQRQNKIVGASSITPRLGQVRALVPNCPEGAICEAATEITLVFPMAGCVDLLGPVHYQLSTNDEGKTVIAV